MNQNLIVKHNNLIEAGYKLSLEEQRLVLACISKLDSRLGVRVPDSITVSAREYSEMFGIQLKNAYAQLREATNNLYERDIQLKGKKKTERMRWVYSAIYNDGEGSVSLKFSPDIKPYLSQLNGMFTCYQLAHVASLRSPYSIRLYELLSQWRSKGERLIMIAELRSLLDLENKYNKFHELKRWVIQPAVNDLNLLTDLKVTFDTQRTGRSISAIFFMFSSDEVDCSRS